MNSERIKQLASNIFHKDIVLDVGTDHGYLCIYLKKNKICKEVYASDISSNALEQAKKNFKKYKEDVQTFLSDGFHNIPVKFNTAVIAGVGTHTILNIINHPKTPNKLVLESHNDLYLLRKTLHQKGYKIVDEKALYEKGHYYNIFLYTKGKQKLTKMELKYGLSDDVEYYQYLINKNKEIIPKVPLKKKIALKIDNLILKGLIGRM